MDGEHWQLEPDDHDFPAARTYLSLICSPSLAAKLVKLLEAAPTSTLPGEGSPSRQSPSSSRGEQQARGADLQKVHDGNKLSPILLVRGRFEKNRDLVIADGYHRVCASYWLDENSLIPCRIVDVPM